ncbi:MAG: DnaA ATPase domain-containing protein, partial [Calditrichia bacterium]
NQAVQSHFDRHTKIEYLVAPTPQDKPAASTEEESHYQSTPQEDAGKKTEPDLEILVDVNPKYTLDNFYSHNENLMVKRAAEYFSENIESEIYNPLYLYGDIGTGKTHIINAIGNSLAKNFPGKKIVYLSGDQFIHEYVVSLKKNKINEFKAFLTTSDAFLLDNVQILSNKQGSQDILGYIVTQLERSGGRIVITSDTSPASLKQFSFNVVSLFQEGLILNITPPGASTREKIIQSYLSHHDIHLESDIIEYIIDNVPSNMHILNALLVRLIAQVSLLHRPVTQEDVHSLISRFNPQPSGMIVNNPRYNKITLDAIVKKVGDYYKIPNDVLCGISRSSRIVFARQVAMYISRKLTHESLSGIGYHFGDRHHASVLHACKKIEAAKKTDPNLRTSIEEIIQAIFNS